MTPSEEPATGTLEAIKQRDHSVIAEWGGPCLIHIEALFAGPWMADKK